jgi:hypothetical protein
LPWQSTWTLRGEPLPWREAFTLLAVLFAGLFILWAGRGTTFLYDEWAIVLGRRGADLDTYLRPHNEHLIVLDVAVYKALFATVGTGSYWPYRLVVALLHVVLIVLVYTFAKRRVGPLVATALCAPLAVFGPGWEVVIYPMNIIYLTSTAACAGILVAFDRGDRRGDRIGCALLTTAVVASSLGIAVAAGVAAEVLWRRDRWRRVWILAIPVLVYGAWYLAYGTDVQRQEALDVAAAPEFAARAAAGALSALLGLPLGVETEARSFHGLLEAGAFLLLLVAVGALGWRLWRTRSASPPLVMILATLGAFWALAGVARGGSGQWYAGRFVYPAAALVVLLLAELLKGAVIPRKAFAVVCVVAAGAAVLNAAWLVKDGKGRRSDASVLSGELAAVEAQPDQFAPAFAIDDKRALGARAGEYLEVARDTGSPAFVAKPLRLAGPAVRAAADRLLVAGAVRVVRLPQDPRPRFLTQIEGTAVHFARRSRGCLHVRPPSGRTVKAGLAPAPYGLAVIARPGTVTLRLRRFSDQFVADPVPLAAAGRRALVGVERGTSPLPWHAEVTATGPFTLC